MLGTMNCSLETPCGWCTKWDKKCDKKIGHNETITYLHDDQEVDWTSTSYSLYGQGIKTEIKGD